MSAEMDRWEREQQRKHTYEKRVKRGVRTLLRELCPMCEAHGAGPCEECNKSS